jgi:cytochrome P450
MMINPGESAIEPAPIPPRARLPLFKYLRTLRENNIAIFPQEAYELPIIERKLLGQRRFIVNDPAALKHVLLDNAANYTKTEIMRRLLEPGLGKGLITSEGETWRSHRRTMAPAFDHRSIASYTPIMSAAAGRLLAQWDGLGAGAAIDASTAMMEVTLDIISRTMFSSDSDDIVKIMERGFGTYQAKMRPNMLDLLGWPAWLAGLRRTKIAALSLGEFDKAIDRLIEARSLEPGSGPKDLLARLIAARDEQTGGAMSAQEVRDQVITIFMAGHETTALTMTWIWYLLSQHPVEEAKLHAELESVLGGREPTYEDLSKLSYSRMIVEESMRLYPPAHTFAREAIGTDSILGLAVPKGSIIIISPWLIHRHAKLWEHPERFDPQRFSAERSAGRPRYSYIPFGAGKRICIGASFAMAEAVMLLATLAQRYQLRMVPGHPVEAQGLITLRPRYGMRMQLQPRDK